MSDVNTIVELDKAMKKLESTKKGIQNRKTAYAFIKALLDMGGCSKSSVKETSFIRIFNRMKEIDPKSSWPVYVVRILKRHRIVINAGSRKYPEWCLPKEEIDAISKAVEKYRTY